MTGVTQDPAPILLVDDDVPFTQALSAALRRRGETVVIAHNVSEAVAEVEAWQPDRAVIDLRIGAESGVELVSRFKSEIPELKMVVLTGFGSIATAVQAVKSGALEYLTKPVSAEDLLLAFEGIVQEPKEKSAPTLDEVEWEHLQRVLTECDGNISEAARRLSMHRRTLQRKLARGKPAS